MRTSGAACTLDAPINWWTQTNVKWIGVFLLGIHIILPQRSHSDDCFPEWVEAFAAVWIGCGLVQLWRSRKGCQRVMEAACQDVWAAAIVFTGLSKITRGSITTVFDLLPLPIFNAFIIPNGCNHRPFDSRLLLQERAADWVWCFRN